MDEDQFYMGETLAGKTGLVPSNYVEQISDSSLLQNAARAPSPCATSSLNQNDGYASCPAPAFRLEGKVSVATQSPPMSSRSLPPACCSPLPPCSTALYDGGTPASPSFALAVPAHLAHITHDFTDSEGVGGRSISRKEAQNPLPDSVCPYPPVDVSKVIVQEVKSEQPRVPIPRELNVEKKLSRSAVFCWLPPDDQLASVSQYHVCVDGAVKAVVPGSYKCKALIEDLNLERSPDAACTLAIGTEAPVAPQHVRVTNITPISAQVYWYPSNSNADHVVLLNAIKVGVCPPAVFQVHLQGLSPSTIYRVSVRTKHPKAVLEKRPVERCVDFKTLPKIGLPDPPQNVQVEVGPQPGTLLISWKPVTNQPRPPSRAAIHSYLIFADGKNIAQCPSATG
uniref:RIMS-binding protein 2 n=1 Tax=Ditylenchus dipsaci TaxID=166011 RepID=A0A915EQV7_9BILA